MANKRRVVIEFLGTDKSASKAAGDVEKSSGRLGRTLGGLGKTAAVGLGAVVVGAGLGATALVGMAKSAAEDQAAQDRLAKTLRNTAKATAAEVKSVEEYISAKGIATGVTDDEMRPALENLLRATKDVDKAQGLMNLALDVSAGTGKDLGAVTMALSKAQNGSVGGLAKLGIATKDAAGKTKSFEQIQKDLAKTFGGQAATAAETNVGKMKRLQLIFDETKESIGAKLLPIASKLADVMLTKVGPALQTAGRWAQENLLPPLRAVGQFIAEKVIPVVVDLAGRAFAGLKAAFERIRGEIQENRPQLEKLGHAIGVVAKWIGEKLGPIVQWLAKNVFVALGYAIGAILDAIAFLVVEIPKAVAWFGRMASAGKDLIAGIKNGIVGAVKGIGDWLKKNIVNPVVNAVKVWFGITTGPASVFIGIGKNLILGLTGGIVAVLRTIGGIGAWLYRNVIKPAVTAFANAGTWLVSKGRALVSGLTSGVVAYLRAITGIGSWLYRNVIQPALNVFLNAGTWLYERGRGLIGGLTAGVVAYLKSIVGIGTWIYNNVAKPAANVFLNAKNWLVGRGRDLISGLLGGIVEKMKGIGTWVKDNIADPVINAVKNFFGIHSPSTVFASIGRYMIAGLLRGMSVGNGRAIATKVFGSLPKALGAIVDKGLISLAGLPKKALDALNSIGWGPQMGVIPPELFKGGGNRVIYQGETMNVATLRKLEKAEKILGRMFSVTQGSWESASSYSGTTHTGGGVVDVNGPGGWAQAVSALKRVGFAAWHRTPSQGPWGHHIHAIDMQDPTASASARAQVMDFLRGGDGLAGRASGGPVRAGEAYRVGERGPETLVMGGRNGYVVPNGGGNTIAQFAINLTLDGRTVQQVLLNLKRNNGGLALGLG